MYTQTSQKTKAVIKIKANKQQEPIGQWKQEAITTSIV